MIENYPEKKRKIKIKLSQGKKFSELEKIILQKININELIELLEFALSCRNYMAVEEIIKIPNKPSIDLLDNTQEEIILNTICKFLRIDFCLPVKQIQEKDSINQQILLINNYFKYHCVNPDNLYYALNHLITEETPEEPILSLIDTFVENGLIKSINAGIEKGNSFDTLFFNLLISNKIKIMEKIFLQLSEASVLTSLDNRLLNTFPVLNTRNQALSILKNRLNIIRTNQEAIIIEKSLPSNIDKVNNKI